MGESEKLTAGRTESSAETSESVRAIPVIEEDLVIEKRSEITGRVALEKRAYSVTVPAEESVTTEKVEIERVPVGRVVAKAESPRFESGAVIVPVYEERVVSEKRLVLVEELIVKKVSTTERTEKTVSLMREAVVTAHEMPVAEQGPEEDPKSAGDTVPD